MRMQRAGSVGNREGAHPLGVEKGDRAGGLQRVAAGGNEEEKAKMFRWKGESWGRGWKRDEAKI